MSRTFFAGILRLPEQAPWERVARQLSLVDAHRNLRVVPTRARRAPQGEGYALGIFLCHDSPIDALDERPEHLRTELARFVDAPIERFGRIEPNTAGDEILPYLVEASDVSQARAISPAALAPAPATDHELVGLEEQQRSIADVGLVVGTFGRDAVEACHFAFMGGPGTGKTALACDLVRRFDTLGVTDGTGNLVKADAAELIGKYVGHTAPQTKEVVERALGGVLYIDEAYGLIDNAFGRECITTLVDLLDTHRTELVCVFAGYRAGIERMLASNEGLRERVPYRIEFPGYTDGELAEIFRSLARAKRFELSVEADEALAGTMARLRRQDGFAEARSVRNLLQDALIEVARHSRERVIGAEDLERALRRRLADACARDPVGFAPGR